MNITITPFSTEDIPKVADFNSRLKSGNSSSFFPEYPEPKWLPKRDGRRLYQEYFLARENGEIRGGYILKHQEFSFQGEVSEVVDLQLPLSEGIIDKKYNIVGIRLIFDAIKREPLLFALGMGGMTEPLPAILKTCGWGLYPVPFFFRIVKAGAFLRNIEFLRRRPKWRLILDLAAFSGLGQLGLAVLKIVSRLASGRGSCKVEEVEEFSEWCDEIWREAKSQYHFVAVRNHEILTILYPKGDDRFHRLKIWEGSQIVAWAVVLDTRMMGHKQFGEMRVGSLVDCLARPGWEKIATQAATEFLEKSGVEMIVSNQSHAAWRGALKSNGYFEGPTNFIFAASKQLTRKLQSTGCGLEGFHINRGDGDGPINL